MDIYTKLFLANFVGMVSTAWIDKSVLKDGLEKLPGFGISLEIWALVTILSIPAWLFYMILTF